MPGEEKALGSKRLEGSQGGPRPMGGVNTKGEAGRKSW